MTHAYVHHRKVSRSAATDRLASGKAEGRMWEPPNFHSNMSTGPYSGTGQVAPSFSLLWKGWTPKLLEQWRLIGFRCVGKVDVHLQEAGFGKQSKKERKRLAASFPYKAVTYQISTRDCWVVCEV